MEKNAFESFKHLYFSKTWRKHMKFLAKIEQYVSNTAQLFRTPLAHTFAPQHPLEWSPWDVLSSPGFGDGLELQRFGGRTFSSFSSGHGSFPGQQALLVAEYQAPEALAQSCHDRSYTTKRRWQLQFPLLSWTQTSSSGIVTRSCCWGTLLHFESSLVSSGWEASSPWDACK